MSDERPSDERFAPGSWSEVSRIIGWRPGMTPYFHRTTQKKVTQDEIRRQQFRQAYLDFIKKDDEIKRKFYGR